MKEGDAQRWVDAAVSGIRFPLDREAVEQELREHIQDKIDEVLRLDPGIDREQAEALAVGQMGDAAEIGAQLARLHRPWLGWLWMASKCLVVVVGVVFAFSLLSDMWARAEDRNHPGRYAGEFYEPARAAVSSWGEQGVQIGSDILQADGAALCYVYHKNDRGEKSGYAYMNGRRQYALTVDFSVHSSRFWETYQENFARIIVTDSLGNRYRSLLNPHFPSVVTGYNFFRIESKGRTLFSWQYQLILPVVDPETEWVRLDYDWQGRSFSLLLEWEGET